MKKLCVIGSGNMGKAMVKGILKSELLRPDEIIMTDIDEKRAAGLEAELGIRGSCDNKEAVKDCELVIMAVKPQFLENAVLDIAESLAENTVVVSIAPGKTLEQLEKLFSKKTRLIRAMPNTPAMVLAGMTAVCGNSCVKREEMAYVKQLFDSFGRTEEVREYIMDSVVAVSGSSPAYVCLMIEALADAAVKEGMTRAQAYVFSEQAVMGTAKLLLDTGMHPGELKDMVCSPAGTSIKAVEVLENNHFRGTVMQAAEACAARSREL